MRLRLVKEPFDHPDYIFELKHDGFRAVAYLQNGECKLISRKKKLLRFEPLTKALAGLPVQNAIIDGEIVCLDAKGVSQFNQLLGRKGEPVLYAFDLLWLDGEDLRQTALLERKKRLAALIQSSACERILYAQHIEEHGKRFFEQICTRDLEGIVAKRKLGIYKDDGNSWLKIKNRAYSQAEGRQELLMRRVQEAKGIR
jgi:bifunctional non-homologous end joining protein LigD